MGFICKNKLMSKEEKEQVGNRKQINMKANLQLITHYQNVSYSLAHKEKLKDFSNISVQILQYGIHQKR